MSESLSLLLTAEEVAEALKIARSRVFDLLAGGDLPSVQIGRSRRITRTALEEYVARLEAAAGQHPAPPRPDPRPAPPRPDPRPGVTRPDPRPGVTRSAANGAA
jgi:excisionase family DNA binding protein